MKYEQNLKKNTDKGTKAKKKTPKMLTNHKQRLEKCTEKYIVEATQMPNSKIN